MENCCTEKELLMSVVRLVERAVLAWEAVVAARQKRDEELSAIMAVLAPALLATLPKPRRTRRPAAPKAPTAP